ncbi:G-type lectin S-receptor-like serine/threonine-protein kinase At2g19130 [Setaria viridis]|uniref:non-specific serine/threonine protein kinase n=1 Tax=Setaria viridis TaxID=4556 RepID=A0A4U6VHH9_SETVI|nr:G-type lectin S-receptor-like serine/threonine-protein kinase At2g19130 isoform X2 [Setaria viridis]XP_034585363.1 G-type lectin S-receptor-like serine/threonine-protein kinase At2g19130 isoform X2 [Setaria viridis]TKW29041.1 hypothetical protein SEVIR_3G369360v2 [Setaria viridis]
MSPGACTLFPLFSILIIITSTCTATRDTISSGHPLAGHDKLVSDNGKFAVGFFDTTGNTTAPRWYLGIWFNAVSKLTPVWVANRESPLAGCASLELMISGDGNLVILNRSDRSILWSSRVNTPTKKTIAVLLNSGNLALSDAANSSIVFWESFSHMTDTFLPGAKLGWSKVTGLTHRIMSNRNTLDLSPGVYSAGPLANTTNRGFFLVWNYSEEYWSTGPWNGHYFRFSNMPEVLPADLFTVEFVSNDQEEYFTYRLKDDSTITRYVLDTSGQAKHMIWNEVWSNWLVFNVQPAAQCDVYAVCGPFTICIDDVLPFCNCMDGFSIMSPQDWELGDRTGGCKRNVPLNCGSYQSING